MTSSAQHGGRRYSPYALVEAAVRWRVLDRTVAETKARNASASAADIDAAIDEALAAVRAERVDPHGG